MSFFERYYPLFGICGNNWYPSISGYEEKKILFEVGELDSLIKKYCKKNINYRGFYEFFDYMKIYYPHSFDEITNKTNMEIK